MAWALLGRMDRAEAMLQRIEAQGIREHAALNLQAIRAARDSEHTDGLPSPP